VYCNKLKVESNLDVCAYVMDADKIARETRYQTDNCRLVSFIAVHQRLANVKPGIYYCVGI
jgi:hypothetical protein